MFDSGTEYDEALEIEQRKLSRNSNGHNFSHVGQIQAHNISRRSTLNNGRPREIQLVITFHTDVRFRLRIYRDARNLKTKPSRNSYGLIFSLGYPIHLCHISRRSKLNNGSSREIQMAITFHT